MLIKIIALSILFAMLMVCGMFAAFVVQLRDTLGRIGTLFSLLAMLGLSTGIITMGYYVWTSTN